jgi:hypothetical protein
MAFVATPDQGASMKTAALLSTALSLTLMAACVVQEESVHPIEDALPTAEQVSIKLPEGASARLFAVGDIADYYVLTRNTTRAMNGITAWVLLVVHTIVKFPATTVDGDVYTWGPWSETLEPAEYRLVVSDLGDGTYDWRLDGRSKTEVGAGFLTVISGNAEPSDPVGHGRGSFLIDFEAAEAVNPIDNDAEQGTAEFTYDLGQVGERVASVAIHGEGFAGAEQPASFDYGYGKNADGSGDFRFVVIADLDDVGGAAERAEILSRWLPNGAGRGDAMLSSGDLGDLSVSASECWDPTFRRVYYSDSAEFAPTEGDAAACVFAEAALP